MKSTKIDKYTVESPTYQKAKNLSRRLRRQTLREEQTSAEARHNGWDMSQAQAETVKVDVNGTVILMDRHTAYGLMHTQQAKLVVDLDTPAEYIAVDAE